MAREQDREERHGRRPQQDEQAASANPPGPGARKDEDLERIRRQRDEQAARSRRHAPGSGPAAVDRDREEDDGRA
ncbi:MAG TPA: hypothetical protein VJ868_04875 [Actinomycetota bacterium]|nr:hypothetical protein [Actinomycetota bacterium]